MDAKTGADGRDGCGQAQVGQLGEGWYFTREDIDRFSPSRNDGIDVKKEAYLRKSYCTFLKDIGMQLKLPQVTIATSIMFCHRFYLRQSHHTNDRYTVATACMFLAGKVEETPRSLRDVTMLAYEIRHKKDPTSAERIKQKEFYEQQKELVLLAERVVLCTLAFDLNVQHPYKYLVTAIKIFKVAQNSLAQVAWNFVNDGLHTTLCLQFRPQHIAAGAIFLAAKFLKVKLPSDGERPWWQEFDVTPRQLEDVSNQMLELYEQTKSMAASTSNDIGSNQDMNTQVPDNDGLQGKSSRGMKFAEDAAEVGIPYRKQPDIDVSTNYDSCKPINYKQCNVKTASDDIVGRASIHSKCGNQGLALTKPVAKWPPEVIQDSECLASNLLTVDTQGKEEVKKHSSEIRNGERKGSTKSRMHLMGGSGEVSLADIAKGGYIEGQVQTGIKLSSDLLEPRCLERAELGEERKRKRKSRWDDPSHLCCSVSPGMVYDGSSRFITGAHMHGQDSELSNVTWINEQAQPTGKIMLSKQEKGSKGQWRENKADGKHGQNMNKEHYNVYPQQWQQTDNASHYCQQQQLMGGGSHYHHPQQQIVTENLYELQQGVNPRRV